MKQNEYVFDDVNVQREWQRLRSIEQVFDPASRRQLEAAGVRKDARCLEVGPGAGSIARWMAEQAGPTGHVTAVDINPRFLTREDGIEVIPGDIRHIPLVAESFDVIHARYVLLHIPDYKTALDKMLYVLKPGGWIVLEEPDFTPAKPVNGTDEEMGSVRRVNQAIEVMYAAKGINSGFGVLLPSLMADCKLTNIRVEMNAPLTSGGSGIAEVMARSAEQLIDQYVATNAATVQDVRTYVEYCRSSNRWAVYYATVSVSAQKAVA